MTACASIQLACMNCKWHTRTGYSGRARTFTKAYNRIDDTRYMVEFTPISQAKKMRSGINARASVKSKGDTRTVNLRAGGTVDVCDAIIADGDGEDNEMKLTLWGDDIKAVNVGDTVVITNGYTNEFRGEVSLTKGRYGQMEVNPQ